MRQRCLHLKKTWSGPLYVFLALILVFSACKKPSQTDEPVGSFAQVSVVSVSDISDTSAMVRAVVNDPPDPERSGICYDSLPVPSGGQFLHFKSDSGLVVRLTNLMPYVNYYVRAFTVREHDTLYGPATCFRTKDIWHEQKINSENKINHIKRDGDLLYVATGKGFYISRDGGHSWQLLGFPNENVSAFDAKGNTIFLSSNTSLHASSDGGQTWSFSATEYFNDLLIDSLRVFGIRGFRFTLFEGGLTFSSTLLDGSNLILMRSITRFENTVLAATSGKHIYRIWPQRVKLGSVGYAVPNSEPPDIDISQGMLIAARGGLYYRINDYSWQRFMQLPALSCVSADGPLIFTTSSNISSLYLSHDNGDSWQIVSNKGLPALAKIWDVMVCKSCLYVYSPQGLLYRFRL